MPASKTTIDRESVTYENGLTAMRAAPGTTAGLAPVGYEQSPLSSFGRLDAECSLPASVVAARSGTGRRGCERAVSPSSRSIPRQPPEVVCSGGGAPDSGTLTAYILSLGSGRRRRAP